MMSFMTISHVHGALRLLRVTILQFGLFAAVGPLQPLAIAKAPVGEAEILVRDLAARSANWIAPPATLEKLEYELLSGSNVTRVRVERGEQRRHSVWMGTTLHAGFQSL